MPSHNTSLDTTPFSIFDKLEKIIKNKNDPDFIQLHQGKTIFPPCAHLHEWRLSDFELLAHQHASPTGITSLKQKIISNLINNGNSEIHEKNILITCGATHGINIIFKAILQPNEEVLILSPQWLFAVGLVRAAGGHAIEVPVFLELGHDPAFDLMAALQAHLTEKTKAIYFNTPNNPTGFSLNEAMLKTIAIFAQKNDLWIVTDNAYENYNYSQQEFIDIAKLCDAKDRTFSVYSFSKTYAMPGYRVGFIVVPDCMEENIKKWGLYSIYSLSTTSQYAAFQALDTNKTVLEDYKNRAKIAKNIVNEKLLIPHSEIHGGLYTFLNLKCWKKGTADEFLNESINAGVSIAPGIGFGQHCAEYARLCFTSVDNESLEKAIERLNKIYSS